MDLEKDKLKDKSKASDGEVTVTDSQQPDGATDDEPTKRASWNC